MDPLSVRGKDAPQLDMCVCVCVCVPGGCVCMYVCMARAVRHDVDSALQNPRLTQHPLLAWNPSSIASVLCPGQFCGSSAYV
jgi:hypothetical protein